MSTAGQRAGGNMRKRLFNWQGQRFVYLGLEGEAAAPKKAPAKKATANKAVPKKPR